MARETSLSHVRINVAAEEQRGKGGAKELTAVSRRVMLRARRNITHRRRSGH
jgi:hypothetical protein